ncbi:hypothetical protein SAMD00019534_083520, partial [Acytostelium subglobosum LB1]|uniref:hypothetical protein n=1 Tax=Acytostelium subglobosum LB1 TaxID=1410327 RepID=UPI000644920C
QVGHIPQSVTQLSLHSFNQSLHVGHIPQSVTQLTLELFNQPLQVGHIPQSVTQLSLDGFNQPLQVGHISHSVTQLAFGDVFNQFLATEYIPSVTSLSIPCAEFSPKNFSLLDHQCLDQLTVVHFVNCKNWNKKPWTNGSFLDHNISLIKMNILSHLVIQVKPSNPLNRLSEGMPSNLMALLRSIPTITLQFFHSGPNGTTLTDFKILARLIDETTTLLVPVSDMDMDGERVISLLIN